MSEVNYDECCSVNFVFSKKATKIDEIFTIDLTLTVRNVKLTLKISPIFVAFLENMNFKKEG